MYAGHLPDSSCQSVPREGERDCQGFGANGKRREGMMDTSGGGSGLDGAAGRRCDPEELSHLSRCDGVHPGNSGVLTVREERKIINCRKNNGNGGNSLQRNRNTFRGSILQTAVVTRMEMEMDTCSYLGADGSAACSASVPLSAKDSLSVIRSRRRNEAEKGNRR